MSGRPRAGMALVVTLVGLLVLEIVVAGVFHIAMQQVRIAHVRTQAATLQAVAVGAVASATASWDSLAAGLAVGDSAVLDTGSRPPRIRAVVVLRRLAADLFFVRAEAGDDAGQSRAVGALLRVLDPARLLAELSAAVLAYSAGGSASIDGSAPVECELPGGAAAEVAALALVDTAGAALLALPESSVRQLDSLPPFARLAGLDLRRLADPLPAATLALAPVLANGACDTTAVANWGAPADPAHPCAYFFPLRHAVGDAVVESGAGQGILIVAGDLTLAAGVRFHGLLLVGGTLRLLDGARVDGAVRAARLELARASIRYDPCSLRRAFDAAPRLRGPFRAAGHWWVPAA